MSILVYILLVILTIILTNVLGYLIFVRPLEAQEKRIEDEQYRLIKELKKRGLK